MNAIAWVVLTLVVGGICGGLVLSPMVVGRSGRIPSRPVWQVMLEGGINGRPEESENEAEKEELEFPVAPGSTTTVPEPAPEPVQLARERSERSAREQNTEQL